MRKGGFHFLQQSMDQRQKRPESQRVSDKSKFPLRRDSDEVHNQKNVQPKIFG